MGFKSTYDIYSQRGVDEAYPNIERNTNTKSLKPTVNKLYEYSHGKLL